MAKPISPARRPSTEVLRQSYSEEEIAALYELARFLLEAGEYRRSETIAQGLTVVAPTYTFGWLVLSAVYMMQDKIEEALRAARQAVACDQESVEGQLFLASLLLSTGDLNGCGTCLGEVGDRINSGQIDNPNLERLYRLELARFESR